MRLLSAQVILDPRDPSDHAALVAMHRTRPFRVPSTLCEAHSIRGKRDGTFVVTVMPAEGVAS